MSLPSSRRVSLLLAGRRLGCAAALAVLLGAMPPPSLRAQEPDPERPAFSLASGTTGSSRQQPSVFLSFRRVTRLDFRVYRVNDPFAFMAGLADPHKLGSEEPIVDQEPTRLERIASWKAARRGELRQFVRSQFSHEYRAERRRRQDAEQVVLRRTQAVNTFAQVPLLNPSQLVTSWQELLPNVRDTEFRRIPLDLREPGMYVVEAVSAPLKAYTVVIVSDVGVVSKAAPGQVLLFAADRFSGDPMAGCDVRMIAARSTVAQGTTAADGTFLTELTGTPADDVVAVTRCGRQVAATDPGGWFLRVAPRTLVGYVYTDKPIYRPSHTAHLKAVLRWRDRGALQPFDRREVELRITDPLEKVVHRATARVDEFGAVHTSWPIPAGAALGPYAIAVLTGDESAGGSFEVQEYRRPEFEVRVTPRDRFVVQGAPARLTVDARYYFGQPVSRGRLTYVVRQQPYYSPLRWTDDAETEGGGWWWSGEQTLEGTAVLADDGTAEIEIPTTTHEEGRDFSVRVEARVTDAGGREVSGESLVHATHGPFMVVLSQDEYVKRGGTTATIGVRVIDYQGEPQPNQAVNVWLERRADASRWQDGGGLETVVASVVTTGADGRATWQVTVPEAPGSYRYRASVRTGDRRVGDTAYLWVPGRSDTAIDDGYDRYLELIADRRSYAPGDVARLVVRGEELGGAVLVTKEGQQVSWHEVARPGGSAIEVPVTDADVGDTWVNVVFLRDDRLFRAERRLVVPATSQQLQLTIAADAAVSRPGRPASITIQATDAHGRPVRAQVSLAVIDESVYGVKPDRTPDPVRVFHRREYSSVGTQFSRTYSFVGFSGTDELTLARARRRPHGLADFKGERAQPQVRREFPDAIHWSADLVTDGQGRARVEVRYPDSLTTWRLTARAVTADSRVGSVVSRTTTTKDLIVRAITPRFLTEGDEMVVPIVTHNYLPEPQEVTVSAAGRNLAMPAGAPAQTTTITVPSGGEGRLDWTFRAERVGPVEVTARAVAAGESDAVAIGLPVLPFGLRAQVSQSGSFGGSGERTASLEVPAHANPAARTIRVTLAPSLAGSLLGALDYLTSFPYGCTEQILSGFLPTLIVSRTVQQLGLTPTERLQLVDRQVTAGIGRLMDMQHDDGGWGWWKVDENHPFMTAYAVYGLLEARAHGYRVDEWKLRQGIAALGRLYGQYPRAVPELKAYMASVMVRGQRDLERLHDTGGFAAPAALDDLWSSRDRMSAYGRALLLQALDLAADARGDDLAGRLLSDAVQSGDLAHWRSDSDPLLDDWMDTSIEATAAAVRALAPRHPDHPVLESAIRYLMASRTGSYWVSTKQTAMALFGLTDYMKARRETGAPVTVRVSVNGGAPASTTFTRESLTAPDPVVVTAPAADGANDVRISAEGDGRVYWTAAAEYFDARTPIERTGSRQLAIVRRYYALAPVQVGGRTRYRETPFEGTARPGDVLLVRISAAGSTDWRYLMIEDPLPAGTEAMADAGLYPLEKGDRESYWWLGRRELRDDRAVFFRDRLPDGRIDLWYLLKVTTPGRFTAMPARITPMYAPDVSASSEPQPVHVPADGAGVRP